MLELIDAIGWIGTIAMFGGSILSIYKHKTCWYLWILGGLGLSYQALYKFNWNILILQLMYMPLNIWGLWQWRKDDESNM